MAKTALLEQSNLDPIRAVVVDQSNEATLRGQKLPFELWSVRFRPVCLAGAVVKAVCATNVVVSSKPQRSVRLSLLNLAAKDEIHMTCAVVTEETEFNGFSIGKLGR